MVEEIKQENIAMAESVISPEEQANKLKAKQDALKLRAKDYVLNCFNKYKDRAGLEDKWEKWDKLYNNISTEKYYQGAADLFPPETRRACKTLINFADEVLWNADPPFKIKGIGGSADTKKAEAITSVINFQQNKTKMRTKLRYLLETLIKYGFVIAKVVWAVKEKYVIDNFEDRESLMSAISKGEKPLVEKKLKTLYDNIDFQVLDNKNIYWDYYRKWEDQTCIIERSEKNWTHLKTLEKLGIYSNIDAVKDTTKTNASNKTEKVYSHTKDMTGLSDDYNTSKDNYELLEASCNFDIDNDGIDEECIITVCNRQEVIRLEVNPNDCQEKPYLWVSWENIEGTSLGMGVPQLAEKSQIALNDFTNQIMDNITQILNNMKVVDALADIPDAELKSRSDGIMHSKTGVDAVKFITPPLTANAGMQAVSMTKEDIRQVTGATVSLQGMPARYDTTATEYTQQGQASARDVFAKLREIEDRIIKEFLMRAYEYDLQYMSREDFIRIVDVEAAESLLGEPETGKTIKETLRMDIDFIPLGVSQIENKVVKGQQLINFLNIAKGLPPGIVDLPKVVNKIWKTVGDNDDVLLPQPTDILISPNDENILISQGEPVHAKPMENHLLHLTIHLPLPVTGNYDIIKQAHLQEHKTMLEAMRPQPAAAPAQEQPQMSPEMITPANAGKVPGVPGGVGNV